jgi:hypothetical protein
MIADISPVAGRSLPLKSSAALVPLDFVRVTRGLSTERVLKEMDRGNLLWVWDIGRSPGSPRHNRELRFLADELCAPEKFRRYSLEEVITGICGERRRFWSAADLAILFLSSKVHIYLLLHSGVLPYVKQHNRMMVSREALTAFLRERRIA